MAIYGYARISRKQQNIERQIRNIESAFPKALIRQEAYTGTTTDRPEWNKLFKRVKSGDTIVFDSVSRMSRNAEEGIHTYFNLMERGVSLVFLKEAYINTDTYKQSASQVIEPTGNEIADCYIEATNKVIKILAEQQIRIAFEQAEKEVEDMRQRTREGLLTAKLNGERIGTEAGRKLVTKKSIECKEKIKKHSKDFGGSLNDIELLQMLGISKNTFYKYKKELKAH